MNRCGEPVVQPDPRPPALARYTHAAMFRRMSGKNPLLFGDEPLEGFRQGCTKSLVLTHAITPSCILGS